MDSKEIREVLAFDITNVLKEILTTLRSSGEVIVEETAYYIENDYNVKVDFLNFILHYASSYNEYERQGYSLDGYMYEVASEFRISISNLINLNMEIDILDDVEYLEAMEVDGRDFVWDADVSEASTIMFSVVSKMIVELSLLVTPYILQNNYTYVNFFARIDTDKCRDFALLELGYKYDKNNG